MKHSETLPQKNEIPTPPLLPGNPDVHAWIHDEEDCSVELT